MIKMLKKRIRKFFGKNLLLSSIWTSLEKYRFLIIYKKSKNELRKKPEVFITKLYENAMRKKLNLANPQSFNEKLQWLKLYWYDEKATICADKYRVREYVKEKGLEHILNDLIAVYDNSSEIDIEKLPEKFVLKATHDCGSILICRDKSVINWKREFRKFDERLKLNYAYIGGEWPYMGIKPRIICEKYLEDKKTKELLDYKFFCFNGEVKLCRIIFYEKGDHRSNFYDMDWKFIEKWQEYPYSTTRNFHKPVNFEEMKRIANILSSGFPHVRVDLYSVDCSIIFGELTFFTTCGMGYFQPESFNKEIGEWIKLPDKKIDPWGRSN